MTDENGSERPDFVPVPPLVQDGDGLGEPAPGALRTKALVFHPSLKRAGPLKSSGKSSGGSVASRPAGEHAWRGAEALLAETISLAQAIDLDIVGAFVIPISAPRPATYIGSGKVDEIHERIKAEGITLVIADCELSPGQQRNLEKAWGAKVIDRTGLILEIFGDRAQTKEGRLQVELAHLNYQRSRLVRSWTHLERQRGGFGFLGGPGETQLEADRRMLEDRIDRIRKALDAVVRTRALHRRARTSPVVALVGYTNAGKSTLFNRLTSADVLAEDMLFATLDPTMRKLRLPSGQTVILSDTVGFISNLPTHLVAAFRATLEEVTEADLIIHVRDIHHAESEAQREDVITVLKALDVEDSAAQPVIEALNKLDLVAPDEAAEIVGRAANKNHAVAISARSGQGIPELLTLIDEVLAAKSEIQDVFLQPEEGAALAWLYAHGRVIAREDSAEGIRLSVKLDPAELGRFAKVHPQGLGHPAGSH